MLKEVFKSFLGFFVWLGLGVFVVCLGFFVVFFCFGLVRFGLGFGCFVLFCFLDVAFV